MGVEADTEPSVLDTLREVASERAAAAEAPAPTPETTPAADAPAETKSAGADKDAALQDGRVRDPKGRFAPKAGAPEGAPPTQAAGASNLPPDAPAPAATSPAETPPPPPEALKPPQGLRAAAREEWTKAPKAIQEEFHRREREFAQTLAEAAEHRKVAQSFREAVSPFEGMIRAEGGEPVQVVHSLLQTAAALRTAPPAHKAQLVANIIRTYGIDVEQLAAAIDSPGQAQAPQQAQFRDPRLDGLLTRLEQAEKAAQAEKTQRFRQEVEAFAASNDLFDDIAPDAARFLKADPSLSLQDAFDAALALPKHAQLRTIKEQRAAAEKAKRDAQGQGASRAAGISVKSQPATPMNGAGSGGGLMDDLRAAAAQLSGR